MPCTLLRGGRERGGSCSSERAKAVRAHQLALWTQRGGAFLEKFFCGFSGLRFLVRLCTDIGLKEVQEYAAKLKRLEKMKEIREQVSPGSRKLLSGSFRRVRLPWLS